MEHTEKMDIFEAEVAKLPQLHVPVIHRFTEGMYIREVRVPKGVVFTSRTHKTQHPFLLSYGVATIVDQTGSNTIIAAPHTGITEAGTRRIFMTHTDIVLTTFHVTELTDPDEWVELNTEMTNNLLPPGFEQTCFEGRKKLKWQP